MTVRTACIFIPATPNGWAQRQVIAVVDVKEKLDPHGSFRRRGVYHVVLDPHASYVVKEVFDMPRKEPTDVTEFQDDAERLAHAYQALAGSHETRHEQSWTSQRMRAIAERLRSLGKPVPGINLCGGGSKVRLKKD